MSAGAEPAIPAEAPTSAVKHLFALLLEAEDAGAPPPRDAIDEAPAPVREAALALVTAHRRAAALLAEPPAKPAELPRVEGYEIECEIGRGGFGVVYRARQLHPVERPVALKILRAEVATTRVLTRFRAESRVLARMNHPGIARVFDAGVDASGHPFLSIELIDGVPLVHFCEIHGLSVRERVRLLAEVCDAVHHAHQRAVIHRDLKPSNVLVELIDGHPRSRVIDFGIAKILGAAADENATRVGARLGTPRYMSPEQLEGDEAADIRSDVYALGVLLCEALTSMVPRDPDSSPSSTTTATPPSELALRSRDSIATRSRELRGDLDRIVLKAVSIDPDLRYASAAALADDLRRFLDGLPVVAAPPSRLYIARKFVARRKAATAGVTIAVISLCVGTALSTYGLSRAKASQRRTAAALAVSERERARAEAASTFLLSDLLDGLVVETAAGAPSIRDLLDHAASEADHRLSADPELLIQVLSRVGAAQLAISDAKKAAATLAHASERALEQWGADDRRTLRLEIETIMAERAAGRAQGHSDRIRSIRDRAVRSLESGNPVVLIARLHAAHLAPEGDLLQEMHAVDREFRTQGLVGTEQHLEVLEYIYLAMQHFGSPGGLTFIQEAYELSVQRRGRGHRQTMALRSLVANALSSAGQTDEAIALWREQLEHAPPVFGIPNRHRGSAYPFLIRLLMDTGQTEEALALAHEYREFTAQLHGENSVQYSSALQHLGVCELRSDNFAAAAPILERVLEMRTRIWGATRPTVLLDRVHLADALLHLDRKSEIGALLEPVFEHVPPGDSTRTRATLLLAEAHVQLLQTEAALRLVKRELALLPEGDPAATALSAWAATHAP